jgi:hypothetical protein
VIRAPLGGWRRQLKLGIAAGNVPRGNQGIQVARGKFGESRGFGN